MTLAVRILGPVAVAIEGVDHPLTSAAQRRLMGILAIHSDSIVTTDRLADVLHVSVGAVRTSVSRLRSVLGSDAVVSEPPGYRLSYTTLDSSIAQVHLHRSRSMASSERIVCLDVARRLWHGRSLAEFETEDWASAAAFGLDELRSEIEEEWIDALIETKRNATALVALASHISSHPFHERPRRSLMLALAHSGRSVEAVRAAQTFRTLLRDEVGSMPSHDLNELEHAILAGELD